MAEPATSLAPLPGTPDALRCRHLDADRCSSCTWLGTPYPRQLDDLEAAVRAALDGVPGAGDVRWEPAASGPSSGFRNKAKMVVGGTLEQPTLGILDAGLHGVDLRDCGLHEPALRAALPVLAELVARARLTPYDVAARRGELKHLIVTVSPDGALMVRLVLRSTEGLPRVRKQLDWLTGRLPVAVLSVNLQPEHKAVLEGPEEIVLTAQETLPMRLGALTLHLRPQGFFQTNTAMAARLYATARAWTDHLAPRSVLDLYCGVGGFALHLAAPGRRVHGLEISADAVRAARRSAAEAGLEATFAVGDAVADPWGGGVGDGPHGPHGPGPWDLVVVNPPRRGLGDGLCARLRAERPGAILYSSCSPTSLARDLTALGEPSAGGGGPRGYRPVRAQVVDLFPQTAHAEVLVLLEPTPPVGAGQRPG